MDPPPIPFLFLLPSFLPFPSSLPSVLVPDIMDNFRLGFYRSSVHKCVLFHIGFSSAYMRRNDTIWWQQGLLTVRDRQGLPCYREGLVLTVPLRERP